MKRVKIHPLTPLVFAAAAYLGFGKSFALLYLFIFLHECTHALAALLLRLKPKSIYLLPWGCMLSLSSEPSGVRGAVVYLAGPALNALFAALGICRAQNLVLALFNLIPVMPLDGGMSVSIAAPRAAPVISLAAVLVSFALCFFLSLPPFLPIFLAILFFFSERNRLDKSIADGCRRHLSGK